MGLPVHRKWEHSSPVGTGGVGVHCGEMLRSERELLTPISAMTAPFHVLMLKSGKAVEQDKEGEVQGNNFPVPFWDTDRRRQNSSIYTNFTQNK